MPELENSIRYALQISECAAHSILTEVKRSVNTAYKIHLRILFCILTISVLSCTVSNRIRIAKIRLQNHRQLNTFN